MATECEDVFGIFMASPAKNDDGSRRGRLCKTGLLAKRQLLAAILNTGLLNGEAIPLDVDGDDPALTIIEAMQFALATSDRKEITRLKGLLDEYNNSGDDVSLVTDVEVPHADPNGTKREADFGFANCQ